MKPSMPEAYYADDIFKIKDPICAVDFAKCIKVRLNMTQPFKDLNYWPQRINSSIIFWTGQGLIFKCIFIYVWRKVSDLQLLDYWKMHMWPFPWHDRITKPPEPSINFYPPLPPSKKIDPHLPWKSFFRKRLPYFMRGGETLCTCSNSKTFGGMCSLNICIEID